MKKLTFILCMTVLMGIMLSTTSVRETKLVSKLTVLENLVAPTNSSYWQHDDMDETITFRDGGTRNDVDNVFADTLINDGTLDLTSLTNTLGEALDLTDEVIMAIKFSLEDDSGATVTISQGASNPYLLLGTTYSFQLKANQSLLFNCDTVLPVVSNTAKTIDYDSSNDSTVLSVILITADGYE